MGVLYLTLERIDVRYHLNWFLSWSFLYP
jgi:hypothetical protein